MVDMGVTMVVMMSTKMRMMAVMMMMMIRLIRTMMNLMIAVLLTTVMVLTAGCSTPPARITGFACVGLST